jgi:hypothetical protein
MIKSIFYSFGKSCSKNFIGRNAFRLGKILVRVFAPASSDSRLVLGQILEIAEPLEEKNNASNPG